ncbi:MAG: cytochrome c3 family protein [Alphaproteobacteria bacterium]
MSQIFRPGADTWLRAAMLVAALAVVALILFGFGFGRSTYATLVGWVRDQPVPFSHQHHAGDLGIDCRYCHATVEVAAHAGFPSTHTCMTCHSQLWTEEEMLAPVRDSLAEGRPLAWNRVSHLPDFVFFNHAIHVDRGIGCATCHGEVDRMPLMWRAEPFQMQWCLDCHRDPASFAESSAPLPGPERVEDGMSAAAFGARMLDGHAGMEPERLDDCGLCHR